MTHAQLKAFVTVYQNQSFTLAASLLGISQSAISHAIRTMEEELGMTLLMRGKAEVNLTEFGVRIIKHATEIIELHRSIEQSALEERDLQQGILNIGSFGPSFSAQILPIILNTYQQKYPNIQVSVEEGEDQQIREWLVERKVELASVVLPENDFDYIPLTCDPLSVLLPQSHPLVNKASLDFEDLNNQVFILTEGSTGKLVLDAFKEFECRPYIRFKHCQIISMLSLVANNHGISIAANLAIPDVFQINHAKIIRKPLIPKVTRNLALAMRKPEYLSPAAKAFVKLARRMTTSESLRFCKP